jgi:hypothetical protein
VLLAVEDKNMENWWKRAAILIAFSLVLGVILVLVKGIGAGERPSGPAPKPEKLQVTPEIKSVPSEKRIPPAGPTHTAPPEKEMSPASPVPATPAARIVPPAPPAPGTPPTPESKSKMTEALSNRLRAEASRELAFKSLFASVALEKDGTIDRGKVAESVYDYLEQHRPELMLSDSDQERLVDLVVEFREANQKVRSASRDASNAPELKQHLRKMQTAMGEFKKMTDVPSENLFGKQAQTNLFGAEPTSAEEDPFGKFRVD